MNPKTPWWGNVLSESDSTWGDRYKWTGREFDAETGLQYNRARYYDPKLGKWTSEDPLGFEAGRKDANRLFDDSAVCVGPRGADGIGANVEAE